MRMELKILGCSGGIGGNLHTTSMLLDGDVLIDGGTGVCNLSLRELARIDHVFVTHSHLDHIACIPLLVDSAGFMRDKPLTIHATEETIEVLKQHIFNWKIWPDFSQIPDAKHPYMRYSVVRVGEPVEIDAPAIPLEQSSGSGSKPRPARRITAIPANHVVPAVGFWLDSGAGSLVFSGDTTVNDELWNAVNQIENLRYFIVETAFSNAEKDLAILSKHYCPTELAEDLRKMVKTPEVFITHLKPGEVELIMNEIEQSVQGITPKMLQNGQIFHF